MQDLGEEVLSPRELRKLAALAMREMDDGPARWALEGEGADEWSLCLQTLVL